MIQSMKWKSEFRPGEEGEFVWDNDNPDMTIWDIGMIRQEVQERMRIEEESNRSAVLRFYQAFIRGQH